MAAAWVTGITGRVAPVVVKVSAWAVMARTLCPTKVTSAACPAESVTFTPER